MLLYEFIEDNTDMIVLTGVVNQIYNRIKDTGFDKKYSLDALLNTLSDRGLDLDREKFIELTQHQPLKNLIANVEGDKVVFKGESSDDSENTDMDNTTGTLEKMAKRAEKKREKP